MAFLWRVERKKKTHYKGISREQDVVIASRINSNTSMTAGVRKRPQTPSTSRPLLNGGRRFFSRRAAGVEVFLFVYLLIYFKGDMGMVLAA